MNDLYSSAVREISTRGKLATYAQRRIASIKPLNVFAARRIADGMEALLLELDSSSLVGIRDWPESQGFKVDTRAAESGSGPGARLYLQLTGERYRDVFYVLCEDICSVLSRASDEREAARSCHSHLIKWQTFLKRHNADGLSPEHQVGLFGELMVLRDLFLPRVDHRATVRAWRGCKKAHQDFQFPGRAMEVKTTRAPIPETISIANVQQLDEDGISPLVLTIVHVHVNETTGETLPDIVAAIRSRVADEAKADFEEGLIEVGYLDIHAKSYTSRYHLNGVLYHEVADDFPRVLRSQLPEGVKKVRYEVSVDAARPFRVAEGRVYEIFGNRDD